MAARREKRGERGEDSEEGEEGSEVEHESGQSASKVLILCERSVGLKKLLCPVGLLEAA